MPNTPISLAERVRITVENAIGVEQSQRLEAARHGIDPYEYWKDRDGAKNIGRGEGTYMDAMDLCDAIRHWARMDAFRAELAQGLGAEDARGAVAEAYDDAADALGKYREAFGLTDGERKYLEPSPDLFRAWEQELSGTDLGIRERTALAFEKNIAAHGVEVPVFQSAPEMDGLRKLDLSLADRLDYSEHLFHMEEQAAAMAGVKYPKNAVIALEHEAVVYAIGKERSDRKHAQENGQKWAPSPYEKRQYPEAVAQRMLDLNEAIQGYVSAEVNAEAERKLLEAQGATPEEAKKANIEKTIKAYRKASDLFCSIPQPVRLQNYLNIEKNPGGDPRMPLRDTFFTMERILSESAYPASQRYGSESTRQFEAQRPKSYGPRPFETLLQKAEFMRHPGPPPKPYGYENEDGGPEAPDDGSDDYGTGCF